MLRLNNIRVWDTGELIDLVLEGPDTERLVSGSGVGDGVLEGVVDASGWLVAPGFVDPHVHWRDPGQCHKEDMRSGARAAAAGGYTRVLIMPNTVPAADGEPIAAGAALDSCEAAGYRQLREAGCTDTLQYLATYEQREGKLPVRYDLCVSATKGRAGSEPSDMARWSAYVRGGYQPSALEHPVVAISDDGDAISDAALPRVLAMAAHAGIVCIDHCERHSAGCMHEGSTCRDLGFEGIAERTELTIVERDIQAARETGVHVHLQHVSTAAAVQAIRQAKAEGVPVSAETAPHYIALCDEDVRRFASLAKMNPPLRSAADRQAVIAGLVDGTIDMIATDHAPHTLEEKHVDAPLLSPKALDEALQQFPEAPNGIIGLECAYAICHSVLVDGGYMSEQRLIELMSLAPSRLLGAIPTDIAGLLNMTGQCSNRRCLDLRALDHAELDRSTLNHSQPVDLVVLAPSDSWQIDPEQFYSKARNTPFGSWQVSGRVMATVVGSRLVFSRIGADRCCPQKGK